MASVSNLRKGYYGEFTAATYDQEYSLNRKELFFFKELAEHIGGPILELGCGTGIVLLPLAEHGYYTVGVDSSKAMLNVFRKKISEHPKSDKLNIVLIEDKMEDFTFSHKFKLAIISNNTFFHLTQNQKKKVLKKLAEVLSKGGMAIIDVFNPSASQLKINYLYYMRGYPVFYKGEKYLVNAYTKHIPEKQKLIIKKEYLRVDENGLVDKRRFETTFELYYLSKEQMDALITEMPGLKIYSVFGSYKSDLYSENSPRIIYLLTRI